MTLQIRIKSHHLEPQPLQLSKHVLRFLLKVRQNVYDLFLRVFQLVFHPHLLVQRFSENSVRRHLDLPLFQFYRYKLSQSLNLNK
jgi:hypothetical protein